MKAYQPTGLGRSIVGFFQEYLPTLRGMSRHTIQSYRDGLILFLQFAATDCGQAIEALEVADITADGSAAPCLPGNRTSEQHHHSQFAPCRFAYLCALPRRWKPRTHGRSTAGPRDSVQRGARAAPIEYLEKTEIEVLLAGIDRRTLSGQRDYAMFSLMFNTGARVQEILNLHVRDVRLKSPFQVRLAGKGNKIRVVPSGRGRRSC